MSRLLSGLRILGYVATLVLHFGVIGILFNRPRIDDPGILVFRGNRSRYLTGWNVALQIVHAFLGLACEFHLNKNYSNRHYRLPTVLRVTRDKLFTNIVFPGSFVVAAAFWILFTYDRELVFPEFLDQIIPLWVNHAIHTIIVPVVLYELLVHPRKEPRTHIWNLLHIFVHSAIYTAVVFYTYYEKGQWLYPVLGKLSPPMFALFALSLVGSGCFFYFLQWRIGALVWGREKAKVR